MSRRRTTPVVAPVSGSPPLVLTAIGLMLVGLTAVARSNDVQLRNGIRLRGETGTTREIGEVVGEFNPGGSIVLVDDGLRRIFFPDGQIAAPIVEEAIAEDVIRIEQQVATKVDIIRGVGRPLSVTPFNTSGRRTIVLAGADGPREFVQGITKITPTYCVLESLSMSGFNAQWESKVATATIPREILSAVIRRQIDETNPNERMKVVQLLIEAERYRDAVIELEQVLDDFPDLTEKRALVDLLRQSYARQILGEIRLRREVGQVRQAAAMLRQFPKVGIAGDLLGQVLELQQEQDRELDLIERLRTDLAALVAQAAQGTTLEADQLETLTQISDEIRERLSLANVARLAGFNQFRSDPAHTIDQKLAFAVSGWLLGEADLAGNLPLALDHVTTRNLVRDYLEARLPHERQAILERLDGQEGADVATIARLASQLTAPVGVIDSVATETDIPGCFDIAMEGDRPFRYRVQLPPEYDPDRRYPVIVTLNGDRLPGDQIDWWAGPYDARGGSGQRVGQATRYGYIVIAPEWRRAEQWSYEYTPLEHARVLDALRDARRRYAVDSDRIFISGHSAGGDAAWDIAVSHPDLFAGLVGITASADKYVNHYRNNPIGKLSMYFVHGEFDHQRMSSNRLVWNEYLKKDDCDVLVVEYKGRGHEHFQEELLRIFEWMQVHRRPAAPTELKFEAMRPWDNFLWWLEVNDMPAATVADPVEWPLSNKSAGRYEARIVAERNQILIADCPAARATVWLAPSPLTPGAAIEINFRGTRVRSTFEPSREVLLEDIRARAERKHPFWARIELPQGRP